VRITPLRQLAPIAITFAAACAFDPPKLGLRPDPNGRDAGEVDLGTPSLDTGAVADSGTARDADAIDGAADVSIAEEDGGVDAESLDGDLDGGPLDADPLDAGAPDAPPPDTGFDAGPQVCTAGSRTCAGRVLRTCNNTGTGFDPAMDVTCDFTCTNDACTYASNLDRATYGACDGTAEPLNPPPNSTVTLLANSISCAPHCGNAGTVTINAAGSVAQNPLPAITWYCLSSLRLDSNVTFVLGTAATAPTAPVAIFVDGDVDIRTTLNLRGANAGATAAGAGGPGGGNGGPWNASVGSAGLGRCGGDPGARQGTVMDWAPGGGGGGGFGGTGGRGGNSTNPSANATGTGGDGGATCGTPELIPLEGGSGGGSGADGSCGSNCGWAGGGGGGVIQISSRTRIDIASGGAIDVSGGTGHGVGGGLSSRGGGGGGGAGGGVLLEAPVVSVAGTLTANGGGGGASGAGSGGAGATGATKDGTNGRDFSAAAQGGAGGGGGGGHIRINAATNPECPTNLSPEQICTTGGLRSSP
jgi:hypothetical protein